MFHTDVLLYSIRIHYRIKLSPRPASTRVPISDWRFSRRLWCVFEVAAYRIANPKGKLTFQPAAGMLTNIYKQRNTSPVHQNQFLLAKLVILVDTSF